MKAIVTRLSLVCATLILTGAFAFQSSAVIDLGAIAAMWLFEEGSGETAIDSSGNGHDGTLINGPQWVQGRFDGALEFDGTDDHVVCGNIVVNNERLSVFAWVKPDPGNNKWIIGKHDNGKAKRSWVIGTKHADNSTLHTAIMKTGDASAYKAYWGSVVIADGNWHHVGFTWNSGELKTYIDGVEDPNPDKQRDDAFTTFTNYDDVDVVMGTHLNNGNPRLQDSFKGIVDEVVIFNAVLGQDDISALMNGLDTVAPVSPAGKLAGVWGAIKIE